MDDVRSATRSLLSDKPSLEEDLEAVLSVDADADGWTFDDVPLDSGTFGELVSRGVVTKDDEGDYRVADRTAVRAALDGDEVVVEDEGAGVSLPDFSFPTIDRNAALALTSALALVVVMRSFSVPSVFRGDAIVLSSNDPYYYRYLVEQLLAKSSNPFDFDVISGSQFAAAKGEPLLVAVLWFVSALLGGGQHMSGVVLALYPVFAAIAVGVLLYLFTVQLTGDSRVGVAAVLMLAVLPDHVLRTSIGFADHHAFDYPWLVLTAFGLVRAVEWPDVDGGNQALAVGCLTFGITGQVLAWGAGPLLILPIGIFTVGSTLMLVATEGNPIRSHTPILVGTGLAAGLVWIVHSVLNWHTDLAASTPALLFVGVLTLTVLAETFVWAGFSVRSYIIVQVLGGVTVAGVVFTLFSDFAQTLSNRVNSLLEARAIAETGSLVQGDLGLFVSPIFWFGLALFLAAPYLVWITVNAVRRPHLTWLVPSTYAWFFLLLAVVQVRFSGEASAFVALFAGIGFFHLLSVVDVTDTVPEILTSQGDSSPAGDRRSSDISIPDRTALRYALVMFLLVASVGMIIAPLKVDLTTIENDQYEAATAISESVDEQRLQYPESYVLSEWSRNRMYNYIVSGESRSYRFARNRYPPFLSATDPSNAYGRINRVGYVITESRLISDGMNDSTVGVRLHEHWGSETSNTAGLGRYQAVYANTDGSLKAFQVVPGAVIEGNVAPGQEVTVSKTVSVNGHEFTYERTVTANENGAYRVRVAYPGEYSAEQGIVVVSPAAVQNGSTVSFNSTESRGNSVGLDSDPAEWETIISNFFELTMQFYSPS
ncbi:STT3 domain-containing protein [Haloarchaeobius salinus]|uniref:STT3 domain-containing protein n=1 Tax=Haloarchaeobius salinus TaxID=1198298 RepID=UPI00210C2442|nr:STT3 domain-containing protein [Haloarchaeobius salinus]